MSAVKIRQIGHLAAAPELKMVGEGEKRKARVRMTVISNRYFSDRDSGDRREVATTVQWTLWDKQAENAMEYLGKGSHVAVEGRLENNNYPHSETGEIIYGYSHVCEDIEYLDSKAEAEARRTRAAEGAPA